MEEEGAGINPKTEYNIRAVQRKWLAFVATFGDRLEFASIKERKGRAMLSRNAVGQPFAT